MEESSTTTHHKDGEDDVVVDVALESDLYQGLDLIGNTKLDEGEAIFKTKYQTDIWFALFYAQAAFMRTSWTDQHFEEAFERLNHVETMAAAIYNKYNESALSTLMKGFAGTDSPTYDINEKRLNTLESLVVQAEANAMVALLHFRNQAYVKGGYYLRKSWKLYSSGYEELKRQLAEGVDVEPRAAGMIYFGVGCFHLGVSMIPTAFVWLVETIGFEKADRETAYIELRAAREAENPRSWMATVALAAVQWILKDNEAEAQKLLDEVQHKYPSATIVRMVRAFMARRLGKITNSIEYFQQALEDAKEVPQLQLSIEYELGHNYYLCCDWKKAIQITEKYLEQSTSRNFKAYASYKLGFCYWMTGEKDKIKALYEKVPSLARPHVNYDTYAVRMAARFLKHGLFSEFEEAITAARNLVEAGKYKSAMAELKKIPPILKDNYQGHIPLTDCVALYRFASGGVYKGSKFYDKAKPHFEKVISLEHSIAEEKWTVPHSYVELADIAIKEKKPDEAEELLKKAKSYTNYDFDKMVGFLIIRGTELIKAMRAEAKLAKGEKN